MYRWLKILFLIGFLGIQYTGYSQLAQSPYTLIGIGDLNTKGLSHNMGMAGTGIAMPHRFNVNNINPALLTLNQYATFEIGFVGENRNLETEDLSQNSGGFNLGYLVLAFPIVKGRWSSSVGLMPYTYVNYNVLDIQQVIGIEDSLGFSFQGSGGMNTIHWAHGLVLFKGLAIGAKISYHFGNIIDETVLYVLEETSTVYYNSALYERTEFSDLNVEFGFAYRQKIKDDLFFTLGGIYEHGQDIRSFRHERLERRRPDGSTVQYDTISYDKQGSVFLPPRYGVGLSLAKGISWKIGVDYTTQDWSLFKDYNQKSDNLIKSQRGSIGIEFIPNYLSVSSYLSRMIYRIGFSYEQTPYLANDIQIEQFGINFGISLPVSRASLLNLGFRYGQRGQTENGLIKESFYNMVIGISFNDRWFIRRQID